MGRIRYLHYSTFISERMEFIAYSIMKLRNHLWRQYSLSGIPYSVGNTGHYVYNPFLLQIVAGFTNRRKARSAVELKNEENRVWRFHNFSPPFSMSFFHRMEKILGE